MMSQLDMPKAAAAEAMYEPLPGVRAPPTAGLRPADCLKAWNSGHVYVVVLGSAFVPCSRFVCTHRLSG